MQIGVSRSSVELGTAFAHSFAKHMPFFHVTPAYCSWQKVALFHRVFFLG